MISCKKLESFRQWLSANGAQVLQPTNEWEVARFKAGDLTSVIYKNKAGALSFSGDAEKVLDAFRSGKSWRAVPRTGKKKKSSPRLAAIRARDGGYCFFCLKPVLNEDESEEHLVPATHGGPNHISNLFLAHRRCNASAGHLSAPEKIAIHVNAILERVL